MKSVLIISPHPDDEILGCGGTLIKYSKSKKIKTFWLIVTKDNIELNWSKKQKDKRALEIKKLQKKLKFTQTYQLYKESTKLNEKDYSNLIENIKEIILKHDINEVLCPSEKDVHTDHQHINKIIKSACKPFRNPSLNKVLFYETVSETNQNFSNIFKPQLFINIDKEINEKIKLMNHFKSEFGKHPFPRSKEAIKSLAILRGSQVNFKFAEAFEIYFQKAN